MTRFVPFLICLFFLAQCVVFIPLLGPQHDEVLFAGILLSPMEYTHKIDFAGFEIFTMLDFYLGALKGWIYAPLVKLLDTNLYALRLPVALLGALTVYLAYWTLARASGPRAAACAALLLAVDPVFVLTTTFDWGPCVLQRLFLIGIFACALAYSRQPRLWLAALAGLLAGLGLWDKLTFGWLLAGCGLAALFIFPGAFRQSFRPLAYLLFALLLVGGAFPTIHANWDAVQTARQRSAGLIESTLSIKLWRTWLTLNGNALYRFFTNANDGPGHLGGWFLGALLLAVPAWWRGPHRTAIRFAGLALIFSTIAMFATHGGAAGAHHIALLWPLPSILLGLLIASLRRPALSLGMLALIVLSAVHVSYRYRKEILTTGTPIAWTDATPALADYLESADFQLILTHDWGISGPLRYLGDNRISLVDSSGFTPAGLRTAIVRPDAVFVLHPADRQLFPQLHENLDQLAAAMGRAPQIMKRIGDRRGQTAFEVVRYVAR